MDDFRIANEVRTWQTLRERIIAQYELEESDPVLIDTLDGETSLNDRIGKIALSAREDEKMAEACEDLAKQYKERATRIERRAKYKRNAIAWAMSETGQTKIPFPFMTISMRMGSPKLIIDDAKLSPGYLKTKVTYSADREAIQAAIDTGNVPDGVEISNAEPILTMRVK